MSPRDFNLLDARLDRIETLILRISNHDAAPYDFNAAARYLDISKSHLYQLTSKNLIGHYKPAGKKIYFDKSDLDAYLKRKRVMPTWETEKVATARISA